MSPWLHLLPVLLVLCLLSFESTPHAELVLQTDLLGHRLGIWCHSLRNFNFFRSVSEKSDLLFNRALNPDLKRKRFLTRADISEAFFESEADGQLPDTFGILHLSQEDSTFLGKGGRMDPIQTVEGQYIKGDVYGFAIIQTEKGASLYANVRETIFHGLLVRVEKLNSQVEMDLIDVENCTNGHAIGPAWRMRRMVQYFPDAKNKERPVLFLRAGDQAFSGSPPIAFDPKENRFYLVNILRTSVDFDKRAIDHFPELEFELSDDLNEEIVFPEHAKDLILEDRIVIAELMVSLHFRREEFIESPKSVIKNHEIFESGNHKEIELMDWSLTIPDGNDCKSFSNLIWPAPKSVHTLPLIRYPGSGSKWLFDMVELATGFGMDHHSSDAWEIPTSSRVIFPAHHDTDARLDHCFEHGRPRRWPAPAYYRMDQLDGASGRAILLIRNPLEAVVSWWRHVRMKTVLGDGGREINKIQRSLYTDKFCQFAEEEGQLWRDTAMDWITLGTNVLVVHYEALRRDATPELRRILDFINFPIDEKRLKCIREFPILHNKRVKIELEGGSPFDHCPKANEIILKGMEMVDKALRKREFQPLPVKDYKYL